MTHLRGDALDAHALACVIAARSSEPDGDLADLLGLDAASLAELFERCFPGAVPFGQNGVCFKLALHARAGQPYFCRHCGGTVGGANVGTGSNKGATAEVARMEEELEDIRALLIEHAAPGRPQAVHLASILARTCLRANHLWEDFGLCDRGEISALMHRNFPRLAARNAGSRMRWKKFLYKQLCERAEINICRAPNCKQCDEYADCFSPEQSESDRKNGVVWTSSRLA